MYVYISLTLCNICYLRLTRTEVFIPQYKYRFIFVSQGTSFHECKIGGIIQKVDSLLKIKQAYSFLNNLFMKTFIER